MLRNLRLSRPIAAIDVETTGLIDHGAGEYPRIVEIAVVRVTPSLDVRAGAWRVDPGIPIPPRATAVHGIDDAAIAGCPPVGDVLPQLLELLAVCDLAGFNVAAFDLPVLGAEIARCWPTLGMRVPFQFPGRLILDAMVIFHHFHPRPPSSHGYGTLAAACRRYLGTAHHGAHGSLWDALAALAVLDAQIDAHGLPRDPRALPGALAGCTLEERAPEPGG